MTTTAELLEAAANALEGELTHYANLAAEAEAKLADVTALRNRLWAATQAAEQEHGRRARAIAKYNSEIEKISRYGKRAAELARAALPVELELPAAVRLVVKGRPAIESAVRNAAAELPSCTQGCGVYFLLEDSNIVYVGQSVDVAMRVAQHRKDSSKVFNRACWVPVPKDELDDVEAALIALLKPRHNTRGVIEHGDDSLSLFYGGQMQA